MFRTLLFAVCAVRAEFWDNEIAPKNSPKRWLDNLKRRLMIDNYDYEKSSDEVGRRAVDGNPLDAPLDALTEVPKVVPQDATQETKAPEIQFVYDTPDKRIDEIDDAYGGRATDNSLYWPNHRANDELPTSPTPQNPVDKFDDEQGISRNDVRIFLGYEKNLPTDGTGAVHSTPKKVSYKIIQPSALSRRSGVMAPRFVEEVGADGVALLSVDGAPFPEFHLPSARRQYQADRDSESDWV